MSEKYILEGKKTVPCEDVMTWGKWFEEAERHVGNDRVGDAHVSTVFLGLDHSFGGSVPLLFETMIFGGTNNEYQTRYSTWDEAEAGHNSVVEALREGKSLP